jgi:cytolysin-activating lysine-acyltransferase
MTTIDQALDLAAQDRDAARAAIETAIGESVRRHNAAVLGEIVRLMLASDLHRRWPLELIERYVVPALHHQQFRLYRDGERVIGYVSWAWLSQDVEDRYLKGGYALTLEDWKSGELPWIIDFVTPHGHMAQVRVALRRERVFGGRAPKAIRPPRHGEGGGQIAMQFGTREARRASPWRSRIINRRPSA